jgi:hypothetical protein
VRSSKGRRGVMRELIALALAWIVILTFNRILGK